MNNYEKNHQFDSALSELSGQRQYDSSFDPTKRQNLKLDSKFYVSNLECFVNELLVNDDTPFVPYLGYDGGKWYTPSPLAIKYFELIPGFIDVVTRLSRMYYYSEPINAFISCCHAVGLLGGSLDWTTMWFVDPGKPYPSCGGVSVAEIFNTLVHAIRSDWKLNNRQGKVNDRKQDVIGQKTDYCAYADSFLHIYARLVLVRVDLFYEKHYGDSIDVFDITRDLDHLLVNARHNSLFYFMEGYIIKLEYGVEKGIHAHVLFFFDGSKKNNFSHIHLAEEIGKYWKKKITKGRGEYWNVNANADQYDKLGRRGIGIINWYDADLRSNLIEFVVTYLCKEAQYFRPKWGPKVKLLRRGGFPEVPVKKLGRPRKEMESYTGLSQSVQDICL